MTELTEDMIELTDDMMVLTEDINVLLNKSQKQFIGINKEYLKSIGQEFFIERVVLTDSGKEEDIPIDPLHCPLHQWHLYNKTKCPAEFVSLTATCPLCNQPMCPVCQNHNVHQLSRVTGYMSDVDNWNSAKQQEFKDRTRYTV